MKVSTMITLASALAPGVVSTVIQMPPSFCPNLANPLLGSLAQAQFENNNVLTLVYQVDIATTKRQATNSDPEPPANRTVTLQDDLVFVLQCVNAGFREPCLSFGSKPGDCVSYFDYDPPNSTAISDVYNNAVSSISTNTNGICQFYRYLDCNKHGDDRGVSINYNNDTSIAPDGDDRVPLYENKITSWRC